MDQPKPKPNNQPAIMDLVIEDFKARDQLGKERYRTRLQPFNGRDSLRDLYEEILDSAAYIRDEIYRRESVKEVIAWLKKGVEESERLDENPDLASYAQCVGVLITANQAKAIISYFEGGRRDERV